MEFASKAVAFAVGLALALTGMGELPRATRWLAEQVASAQPKMMSLSKFNQKLQSSHVHRKGNAK